MDTGRRTVPLPEKHLGPRVRGGDRSVSGDAHGVCWVGGETYGFRPTGSSRREPLRQTRKIGNRKSCVSLPSPAPHRRLPRRRCGPAPLRTHRRVLAVRSTVPCLGAQVATAKMNLSDEVDLEAYVSRPDKLSGAEIQVPRRRRAQARAHSHARTHSRGRWRGAADGEARSASQPTASARPHCRCLCVGNDRRTSACARTVRVRAHARVRAHTRAGDLPRSGDASGAEEPVRRFTPCMLCIAHVMPPVT